MKFVPIINIPERVTTMIKGSFLFGVLCFLFSSQSYAAYCATGKIEGNVCKGFIIESCSSIEVHAVEGDDGKLYEVKRCYEDVSEFDANQGRCWIRTKSSGGGLISGALNLFTGMGFYHRSSSGNFEEVDAEYLTFQCRRT